ncbi:hypothetical protein BDFB_010562, partial [Asbolus verrucosus]
MERLTMVSHDLFKRFEYELSCAIFFSAGELDCHPRNNGNKHNNAFSHLLWQKTDKSLLILIVIGQMDC